MNRYHCAIGSHSAVIYDRSGGEWLTCESEIEKLTQAEQDKITDLVDLLNGDKTLAETRL